MSGRPLGWRPLLALALLLAATPGPAARAEPADPGPAASAARSAAAHLRQGRRLLGDPGGWRSRLEDLGIGLQLFYNQYLGWKPAGGGANPDSATGHNGSYDLFALVDVEELLGWPGLDLLLHVKGQYDRNVNADVGSLSQPIDDADFDEPIYVDELWLQQAFLDDRVRLRLGLLEQQTVFDRNAYANSEDRQFLTTFLDNNAVVPLPSGLGAVLLLALPGRLELALGAADADNRPRSAGWDSAFDGVESLTGTLELTHRARLPTPIGALPGSYRIGFFLDGREKQVFGRTGSDGQPVTERGHLGAYLSFDQQVYREAAEGLQGLGIFGRFGYADPDVNRLAWFWSLGLQYVGAVPGRALDVLGVGAYQAIGSDCYRDAVDPRFERETGIEVYYRIAALPWLAVTPDFQYVIDPGATGSADDAVLAVLRLRVAF